MTRTDIDDLMAWVVIVAVFGVGTIGFVYCMLKAANVDIKKLWRRFWQKLVG